MRESFHQDIGEEMRRETRTDFQEERRVLVTICRGSFLLNEGMRRRTANWRNSKAFASSGELKWHNLKDYHDDSTTISAAGDSARNATV